MRLRAPACSILLLLAGCPMELPGESVGTFAVQGRLDDNQCGAEAVPARDAVEFPVEIRLDEGHATWRRPDAPLISGEVTSDGAYEFEAESRLDVLEGDPAQGRPACVLIQREVVTVRILGGATVTDAAAPADAGPADPDGGTARDAELEGTHSVELSPVSGSDCTPVLAVAGGPFRELPCALQYELDGTEREPF